MEWGILAEKKMCKKKNQKKIINLVITKENISELGESLVENIQFKVDSERGTSHRSINDKLHVLKRKICIHSKTPLRK